MAHGLGKGVVWGTCPVILGLLGHLEIWKRELFDVGEVVCSARGRSLGALVEKKQYQGGTTHDICCRRRELWLHT